MKLTRFVLLEKSYPFKRYNNPYNVPDYLWEYAYGIMGDWQIATERIVTDEFFTLYTAVVLKPLLKYESYIIMSPFKFPTNNSFWVRFTFDLNHIRETYMRIKEYDKLDGAEFVKRMTYDIWNDTNRYIENEDGEYELIDENGKL